MDKKENLNRALFDMFGVGRDPHKRTNKPAEPEKKPAAEAEPMQAPLSPRAAAVEAAMSDIAAHEVAPVTQEAMPEPELPVSEPETLMPDLETSMPEPAALVLEELEDEAPPAESTGIKLPDFVSEAMQGSAERPSSAEDLVREFEASFTGLRTPSAPAVAVQESAPEGPSFADFAELSASGGDAALHALSDTQPDGSLTQEEAPVEEPALYEPVAEAPAEDFTSYAPAEAIAEPPAPDAFAPDSGYMEPSVDEPAMPDLFHTEPETPVYEQPPMEPVFTSAEAAAEPPVYAAPEPQPVPTPAAQAPQPVPAPAAPTHQPVPAPAARTERPLTYLAPGAEMESTLKSAGDVEIAGKFKGDIISQGRVTLRTSVTGNITAAELLLVNCTLTGNARVGERFTIDAGSAIHGNIFAGELLCSGRVTGDTDVTGLITLDESAVVRGSIRAGVLSVARGALITGNIQMGGEY